MAGVAEDDEPAETVCGAGVPAGASVTADAVGDDKVSAFDGDAEPVTVGDTDPGIAGVVGERRLDERLRPFFGCDGRSGGYCLVRYRRPRFFGVSFRGRCRGPESTRLSGSAFVGGAEEAEPAGSLDPARGRVAVDVVFLGDSGHRCDLARRAQLFVPLRDLEHEGVSERSSPAATEAWPVCIVGDRVDLGAVFPPRIE